MGDLSELGLAAGVATASGLRLYGTVAVLGVLQHFGVVTLPPGLHVLGQPVVIVLASVLYAVEFVADKVPAFDSFWDGVQTFIRVPAAAVLGYAAMSAVDEPWRAMAALLCGSFALSTHGLKASTRMAVNTSPEPFSNWILSFGEEAVVLVLLWLAVAHPVIALVAAVTALVVAAIVVRWMWRMLRRLLTRPAPGRGDGTPA